MYLALLIAVLCGLWMSPGAEAQTLPPDVAKSFRAEAAARLEELKNPAADVPDNEMLLGRQYDKIDNEIERWSRQISSSRPVSMLDNPDALRSTALELVDRLRALNCETQSEEVPQIHAAIRDLVNKIAAGSNQTYLFSSSAGMRLLTDMQFFNSIPQTAPRARDPSEAKQSCVEFKGYAEMLSKIPGIIDALKSIASENSKQDEELRAIVATLILALKQRRVALQEKINTKGPQQQVASYLWIIMIVIGISGIATMLVVRTFGIEIQTEWVASGQVIQFVTVMILLSVIMALGLSGILKENTLGTLLGGIAGYVLAQGVGRAAAREAAKSSAGR